MSAYRYEQLIKDLERHRQEANKAIEYEEASQRRNKERIEELEERVKSLLTEVERLELENRELKLENRELKSELQK